MSETMLLPVLRLLGGMLITCAWVRGGAVEIEIGGPRHVQASIDKVGDSATCRVRFVPVSCFDEATNRSLNQSRSKLYACQALSKMLGVKSGQSMEASCRPLAAPEIGNGSWAMTYRFEGITVADRAPIPANETGGNDVDKTIAPPITSAGADRAGGDLLSCVDDTKETIKALSELFESRLAEIVPGERLDEMCVDLESDSSDAFAKLSVDIQSRKLLLGTEKAELLAIMEKRKGALLDKLRKKHNDLAPAKEAP